jgi:hypothetical protein
MLDPGVRDIVAVAGEERLPILVHAGRGIPALGEHVLAYAGDFPEARFILAHAGVCDLAWIWQRAADHPNVFFDTAWWSAADMRVLFTYVPPGQILYATDIPFGTPASAIIIAFRAALQAGLSAEQLAGVAGGQIQRLIDREEPLDLGPAPGGDAARTDLLLDRVGYYLVCAFATIIHGGNASEYADLARLACRVGHDAPQAAICRSIVALLDLEAELVHGDSLAERIPRIHLIAVAASLAATPGVPAE